MVQIYVTCTLQNKMCLVGNASLKAMFQNLYAGVLSNINS